MQIDIFRIINVSILSYNFIVYFNTFLTCAFKVIAIKHSLVGHVVLWLPLVADRSN